VLIAIEKSAPVSFSYPRHSVPQNPVEQSDLRPDFFVEVATLDSYLLPAKEERDPIRRIELDSFERVVAQGCDVAVLVAEFEHDGAVADAA